MSTSISVNAGAGTGASVSLDAGANDTRGEITLTTTANSVADSSFLTVTFGSAYATVPYVHLQRGDQASNNSAISTMAVINRTVNGFDIGPASGNALPSLSGLKFSYLVTP